jgi:endogenous inhibitor of DNA gyrase (YacG/DUF329 family)
MIRASCPICARTIEIDSLDELPSFPFCSDRCKLIDLGRWLDSRYVVPGSEPEPDATPDDEEATGDDEET